VDLYRPLSYARPLPPKKFRGRYVEVAEIKIDPAQIGSGCSRGTGYSGPYAVSDKDNSAHVKVFEIYRDMHPYQSHSRIRTFQEIKGNDGEDGQVAQAHSNHTHHARRELNSGPLETTLLSWPSPVANPARFSLTIYSSRCRRRGNCSIPRCLVSSSSRRLPEDH
jgi:hypothetical protein